MGELTYYNTSFQYSFIPSFFYILLPFMSSELIKSTGSIAFQKDRDGLRKIKKKLKKTKKEKERDGL